MPANHCIPHTPEARERISKARLGKGKWVDLPSLEITKRLLETEATTQSIAQEYGCSKSTIKLILRKNSNKECRLQAKSRKQGKSIKGRPNPLFKIWFEKHRQEVQSKAVKALHKHPNKWESKAMVLINKSCPSEYRFTGNGNFMIGNFNPDFVNTNGQKKLIEVFGEYWHKGKGIRKWHQSELGRIMLYNAFGFQCLILWANDLENKTESELLNVITKFNGILKSA